jgi:hypothetical protein
VVVVLLLSRGQRRCFLVVAVPHPHAATARGRTEAALMVVPPRVAAIVLLRTRRAVVVERISADCVLSRAAFAVHLGIVDFEVNSLKRGKVMCNNWSGEGAIELLQTRTNTNMLKKRAHARGSSRGNIKDRTKV